MNYSQLYSYQNIVNVPAVTLTVAPSGDYTTVKEALIVAVASATVTKPYRVFIRNGTYNEIQMTGGDWVTVEGESRDGVIIISDGLRTDVDPISGQRYVDMAQVAKHCFLSENNMTYRNLTIRANDVKYCIHSDQNGSAIRQKVVNCLLQHSNGYPVGCGARASQILEFDSCVFEKLGDVATDGVVGSHGLFWHSTAIQTRATQLIVNNCTSINCGLSLIQEMASTKSDLCKFINCASGESRGVRLIAATDAIAYNINILTVDSTLTIDCDATTRPDGTLYIYQV